MMGHFQAVEVDRRVIQKNLGARRTEYPFHARLRVVQLLMAILVDQTGESLEGGVEA